MGRQSYFTSLILFAMPLVLPMQEAPGYVPEQSNTLVKNLNSPRTLKERPQLSQLAPAAANSLDKPDVREKKQWVRMAHLGHSKTKTLLGTKKNFSCSYHHPDDKSGRTICLEVIHTDLDCIENGCNHEYDNCALEIDYTLTSDQQDDVSVDASVTCKAEIVYLTKHGYILRSGAHSVTEHHRFKAQTGDSFSISLAFPFSLYEGVVRAQLNSLECHLNGQYHH
ncbi:MAG: hypothetical protein KJO32_05085 [Deltaproteobacteria bacterium]|nr:hypothetical protein [Deltaproteobacteria bacterium]